MVTYNGLKDQDDDLKKSLIKDAQSIINAATSTEGHLGDIISSLKTTCSSIDIKAEKLKTIFKEQKKDYNKLKN
jgi:hypothetical protein